MRNQAIIDRFLFLRKLGANDIYIKHKEKTTDLILSFTSFDDCWKNLRASDAWIMMRREKDIMEEIKNLKPKVFEAVESLAEIHLDSL